MLTVDRLGAARPAAIRDVIKIVSSLPRTGSAKAQTDTIVNGIKIALAEADYRAGEFKIEYADWDDATAGAGQWTAEAETANANRAVRDPDVMVYLGTYNSGAAKISMPILNKAGLLMISPVNTWPGLTKPGMGDPGEPDIYRPTGEVSYAAAGADRRSAGPAGRQLGQGDGRPARVRARRQRSLRQGHRQPVHRGLPGPGHRSAGAREHRRQGPGVQAADGDDQERCEPDLVYFGGTTQTKGGQIAKDMVAAGLDCKLMVPDACYEEAFIESAGAENVNDRVLRHVRRLAARGTQRARASAFVEKYRKQFGGEPEGYAIYGYEAAKAALEAIRLAGVKDREAIRWRRLAIKDFDRGRWAPGRSTRTATRRSPRSAASSFTTDSSSLSNCSVNNAAAALRTCRGPSLPRRARAGDVADAAGCQPIARSSGKRSGNTR